MDTVVTKKEFIYYAARLLWNNENIKRYFLIDTDDAILNEHNNVKAVRLMWDCLAEKNKESNDPIKVSGWKRSDTSNFFSDEEMREFADNIHYKTRNIVSKKSSILEIGIASGISCCSIAPLVNRYYGTDISEQILSFTEQYLKSKNIQNVTLINCEATEINNVNIPQVDLVLLNSVIQYFPGYNYIIDVLYKAIRQLNSHGYIFIGDVLDLELFKEYRIYRRQNQSSYNREQYYAKKFFENLPQLFNEIKAVKITYKIGKMNNELNMFRYDVLLEIDKEPELISIVEKFRCARNLFSKNKILSKKQIVEYLMQNDM